MNVDKVVGVIQPVVTHRGPFWNKEPVFFSRAMFVTENGSVFEQSDHGEWIMVKEPNFVTPEKFTITSGLVRKVKDSVKEMIEEGELKPLPER